MAIGKNKKCLLCENCLNVLYNNKHHSKLLYITAICLKSLPLKGIVKQSVYLVNSVITHLCVPSHQLQFVLLIILIVEYH